MKQNGITNTIGLQTQNFKYKVLLQRRRKLREGLRAFCNLYRNTRIQFAFVKQFVSKIQKEYKFFFCVCDFEIRYPT